jgi:protein O-mannosyl-transferase
VASIRRVTATLRRLLPAALLLPVLGLAGLTYLRVLDAPFLLDDVRVIARNPDLGDLHARLRALWPPGLWTAARPVVDLTFALDVAQHGLSTRGFHLVNLALHLATAALAFLVGRSLLERAGAARPDAVALVAAGLFALHPLQTEAVSYLVQRSEVLASLLYLAGLSSLLVAEREGRTLGGAAAYAVSLLVFALGLGTKAIIVTLPIAFVLIATTARPGETARLPRRLLLVVPHLALGAAAGVALLRSLSGGIDAGFDIPGLTAAEYLQSQPRVILTYLRLLAWPVGQSVEWSVPVVHHLDVAALAAAAALSLVAAGAAVLWRRGRRLEGPDAAAACVAGAGVLWFFLLLAPTSSVVPLADLLAEHRVYLAGLGVALAVAVVAERLLARLGGRGSALGVLLVLAAFSSLAVATYRRNAAWESPVALFTDAVAKAPARSRAHFGLAVALHERGDLGQAVKEYQAALERARGQPGKERQILQNMGVALIAASRLDEAAQALQAALERAPGDARLMGLMAQLAWRRGDLSRARSLAEAALAARPEDPEALMTLGVARIGLKDQAGGIEALESASRLAPGSAIVWFNLATAHDGAGDAARACDAFREAVRLGAPPELRARAARRATELACPAAGR